MDNLEETRKALLELVQDGEVYATPRLDEHDRRLFVADIYATEEDREFTKVWLQHPHFGLNG